ncbi:MAG: redoxin domain-containing protein [Candidatus Bipolaricaulaceae bacterium]
METMHGKDRKMRLTRWISVAMATLVTGWAVAGPCPHDEAVRPPPGVATGPAVGHLAPPFTLPTLSGEELALASFRGCVVLLEFWASWCDPCRPATAHLKALYEELQGAGLIVVRVSLDLAAQAAAEFAREHGHPDFVELWGSFAAAREVAASYDVHAVPRAFLVDRRGVVRWAGHPSRLTAEAVEPWL